VRIKPHSGYPGTEKPGEDAAVQGHHGAHRNFAFLCGGMRLRKRASLNISRTAAAYASWAWRIVSRGRFSAVFMREF